MNHVYLLQDATKYVVGATYEEAKAIQICKEKGWTYRMTPFYSLEGTVITVTAGPIPKEYFPSSERTLMGDFKPH